MLRRWRVNSITLIIGFISFISCDTGPRPKKSLKEESKYETFTIEIKNMKFIPDTIEVKKGDKIVFVNRDMVNHCVTEETKAWTSGSISHGESYVMIVDKPAEYFCAIHVVMKGKIIVR